MDLQATTRQFIDDLQRYSNRKLAYPQEVGYLLDQSTLQGLDQPFRDAIFHAKFAVKTKEIMSRIGRDGEGFGKLSTEFQNSLEKTSALLKTIVKESPEDIKRHFVTDFFSLDQASFANFMKLLEDLSWVKNWEVDGKPLPLNDSPVEDTSRHKNDREAISRLRKGSILGIVLMILLLIIDPPVAYLGWGLAIIVVTLFLYIAIASRILEKK